MSKKKYRTHKYFEIKKFFRGGSHLYYIYLRKLYITKADWDNILGDIGEETSGGENYGYTLYRKQLRSKPKKGEFLRWVSDKRYWSE